MTVKEMFGQLKTECKTLLETCKVVRGILESRQELECPFCYGTGEVCDTAGTTMDCEECDAYAIDRLTDAINSARITGRM